MAVKRHDRANRILHLLLQKGRGSVEDLALAVNASPASIRRDLIELEQRGLVNRTTAEPNYPARPPTSPFASTQLFRCAKSASPTRSGALRWRLQKR
jgi:DeoR family transcriptional regulator, aga operon transcriptional repressor